MKVYTLFYAYPGGNLTQGGTYLNRKDAERAARIVKGIVVEMNVVGDFRFYSE